MDKDITDQELISTLQRLERFANFTDSYFRIPFTTIRIGVDALIGLIPIAGETIGLLMSFYLVIEASKIGIPKTIKIKMIRNILIDFLFGLVPIIGDAADIIFKANMRNMKLLVEHINIEHQIRHEVNIELTKGKKSKLVVLLLSLLMAIFVYVLFVLFFVL